MTMTAIVQAPISEPTTTPTLERLHSLPSLGAWAELCRLSVRWRDLCRVLEKQAVEEALNCSQTPSAQSEISPTTPVVPSTP